MTDVNNKPQPQAQTANSNEDEIDLGRLFGLLLDAKWTIIGITLVAMLCGVAYALLATPVYKADALLQVEKKSSGMPALGGDMAEMFAQESEAETEIQIMKSRMVIGAVVDQLDLTIIAQPDYAPIIGNFLARRAEQKDQIKIAELRVPAYATGKALTLVVDGADSGVFGTDSRAKGASYDASDDVGRAFGATFELIYDDKVVLSGNVGSTEQSGGWLLNITDVTTPNTNSFTLVKTSRLSAINHWTSQLSVSEQGKQSGILSASIQHTNAPLAQQVLDGIAKEYMLQNIRRNAAEAQNSLEFIEKQLPNLKSELTAAEEKLNQYRLKSQSVDLSMETEGLLKQVVEYEKRLNELSFKEAELARLYTQQHPQYQALLEQKQRLQNEQAELMAEIEELPETQQEVLRLTRDVEVNQEIYLQLLNRMQELNVMKAGTVGNVRILDDAVIQPQPVAPKKPLIVVLATMLGGMLAVGLVFVRAAFNRGIESPEQLEDVGIPVYASVPRSETQEKLEAKLEKHLKRRKKGKDEEHLPLLAQSEPTDLSIEALRGLRTSLHFAMLEAKNNILMISGPSPAVGKSFITANLAAVLAQSGKKVLAIDTDLRRGYLHNLLHVDNDNGLSQYLSNQCDEASLIKQTHVANLDTINRGMAPPNPSELLMHPRFEELLNSLSKQYDYVLCDTPPILAVTDAAIVGRYAGTNMLVTRYGRNPVREVEATIKRFAQNGVEIKGAVLNSVERKPSSYYGYGYGYGYGYEYKSK
ncbi:tyrosine-protein kinase Etk/Wzc [Idiomarina fontislapidosi]|uniref:Tyrosine-protein kinase n=1 Tax=Idiomarina fontislapidosi TaxID=263723 RepID=A0A432XN65_9GAMM|nr:polysaccharide biosynthesis tyrosine autokinase [Idiomarina fontislapidosi]PYE30406.1 tyrosine-protein kinase Etk/Wzc [Idiomarina fontislapidosi]RUO50091.1 tyrosine-protein kinase [Idiomarina fontislapidosi]